MKFEQKIGFFHIFINTCFLVSLILSGALSFFLYNHYASYADFSSGQLFLVLFNILLLILIFGAVNTVIGIFFKKISRDSKYVDELTGFMTRHAFVQIFEHVVLDSKRTLDPVSILLIDIDHFRLVNEAYGHQTGDKLLILLSKSIQVILRASDITCRWGGDQMLVVLKDCTEQNASRLAENLLEIVRRQKLQYNDEVLTFSTSIGVSQMVTGDNTKSLVNRAETGLHSARDKGRSTFAVGYEWILLDYYCEPIF